MNLFNEVAKCNQKVTCLIIFPVPKSRRSPSFIFADPGEVFKMALTWEYVINSLYGLTDINIRCFLKYKVISGSISEYFIGI